MSVLFALTLAVIPAKSEPEKLKIVATTGMIGDAASRIGGDLVEVTALMGPGVDPHSYRQTRSDIVAMTRADLVLWHGLYLEAQMEEFFGKLSKSRNVVAVADTLPDTLLISHEDYNDKKDPHVWMDPELWAQVMPAITAALSSVQPESEAEFAANAAMYQDELLELATYGKKALETVSAESRILVTAHDAFNYFGLAHDFEVIGIQGISTESEAGINRMSELVDLLVGRKIGAVFVESSVSDRNIRALIEGAASRGHKVTIGGELFSDAMGVPGSYEGTYLGMLDHNITTITGALGGNVSAKGMSGMLSPES